MASLLIIGQGSSARAAPYYQIVDIGSLGMPNVQPKAVGADNTIVGEAMVASGRFHGFRVEAGRRHRGMSIRQAG